MKSLLEGLPITLPAHAPRAEFHVYEGAIAPIEHFKCLLLMTMTYACVKAFHVNLHFLMARFLFAIDSPSD